MLHKIGYNFGLDGMPMTMYRGICPNSPNQADHLSHASLDKKARPQIGLPVTCLTRGRSLTGSSRLVPLISDRTKPTFDHSSHQLRTGKMSFPKSRTKRYSPKLGQNVISQSRQNVISQNQDKMSFSQNQEKCHFSKSGQNVIFQSGWKCHFQKSGIKVSQTLHPTQTALQELMTQRL